MDDAGMEKYPSFYPALFVKLNGLSATQKMDEFISKNRSFSRDVIPSKVPNIQEVVDITDEYLKVWVNNASKRWTGINIIE